MPLSWNAPEYFMDFKLVDDEINIQCQIPLIIDAIGSVSACFSIEIQDYEMRTQYALAFP